MNFKGKVKKMKGGKNLKGKNQDQYRQERKIELKEKRKTIMQKGNSILLANI